LAATRLRPIASHFSQQSDNKLREIQNNWDKDNWFSKLDRHETEKILGQQQHRLLMLAAIPRISPDCPESFPNNLKTEICNYTSRFLSQYYPPNSDLSPVEFYGNYFKEPISRLHVKQLQAVLGSIPAVVLYSDITDYEVNFHLRRLKKWQQAKASFEESLALQPSSEKAWYYQGLALSKLKKWQQAKASLDQALKINPDYSKAWQVRGDVLLKLGDRNEAEISYWRAFVSNPKKFSFEVVTINTQGQVINRTQKEALYYEEDLGNGVLLEMVAIPGGRFVMGSPKTEAERYNDEGPQHPVEVPAFLMGKYPITQAQYEAIMGENPSRFRGANNPVEQVTWYKAKEFCQRLSAKTGREYRLPSEAQWEYACRAGTTTPFHCGETISTDLANYDGNYTYASGSKGRYREETTPVGSFPPNAFGLYDMHGNVWEWCADPWHDHYNGAPIDGSAWTQGGDDNRSPLRGGSWLLNPLNCRSAYRYYHFGVRVLIGNDFGFRVVCGVGRTP